MGKIVVKYLVTKRVCGKDRWYWRPKPQYFVGGEWSPCPLKCVRVGISGKAEDALREAEELNAELKRWREEGGFIKRRTAHGTLQWLSEEYYKDEMYTALADSSRKQYRLVLETIVLPVFGDIPCSKITRQQARLFYHSLIKTPRTAEYAIMVTRRLLHFGRNIGIVTENPFTEMGIKKRRRREQVWNPGQIDAFLGKALEMGKHSMWLAMTIASTLGTDRGTTRLLPWTSYNGSSLRFSRSKTGAKITIPLAAVPHVKTALDSAQRKSMQIITSEATNRPYTGYNFNAVFRRVADEAGVPRDLQFKDLRRTAVSKLHRAGCTVPEIASITGWSIANCHDIIRHYFTDTEETAGNALVKLQIKTNCENSKSRK